MRTTRYAITVGVNAPSGLAPLNYATRDARALAHHFRSGRGGSFWREEVECLLDWNATVQDVYDALRRVPRPVDALAFTFSGHGNLDGIVLQDGFVPFRKLAPWISAPGARRTLVISDSCGSGGLTDYGPELGGDYNLYDRDDQYDIALFNALPGARVLASCARRQSAYESAHVRHGAFTWMLLESAKFLPGNSNDIITADAAFSFATGCLNHIRWPQTPLKYGLLKDFPFAVSGRRHGVGKSLLNLTPHFPNDAGHLTIDVEAVVVGRRGMTTWVEVLNGTRNGWTRAEQMEIRPDHHESRFQLVFRIPFSEIPNRTRYAGIEPVKTVVRVLDADGHTLGQDDFQWRLMSRPA